MKTAVLGMLIGAGLLIAAVAATPGRGDLFSPPAEPSQPMEPEGQLIALSTIVGNAYQQVTVIDPRGRAMSVYHIDLASGAIELRCVRRIHWDLLMNYYNGKGLLPGEIQSQLELR